MSATPKSHVSVQSFGKEEKEYEIIESPDYLPTRQRLAKHEKQSEQVRTDRQLQPEHLTANMNMLGRVFDYEAYFEREQNVKNYRAAQMPVKSATPSLPSTPPLQTKEPESSLCISKKVKQRSAVQMVNDLTYLYNNHKANVHFKISNNHTISVHSLILLIRSAWFRRSWRMAGDESCKNSELLHDYDFNYKAVEKQKFERELEITLKKLPHLSNGTFDFEVTLLNDQDELEFLQSFNQLNKFLYTGGCEIDAVNSKHLLVLSQALQIHSLKAYISDYYKTILNFDNIDDLIEAIEIAHVHGVDDLKLVCIESINKNSILVVNAASWKRLVEKYPELALQIFRKK